MKKAAAVFYPNLQGYVLTLGQYCIKLYQPFIISALAFSKYLVNTKNVHKK